MDIGGFRQKIEYLAKALPEVIVVEDSDRGVLRGECNPHVHSGWEFKFLKSGDLHLVPPGVVHEATGICPWSLESSADLFTLSFEGSACFFNCETGGGNLLPELFALYVRATDAAAGVRRQLLLTIFEAIPDLVEAMERRPVKEDRYLLALEYMKRNYYKREFSVEELAASVGVTPQYLNRLFRRHGEAGVRRSLIAIRLEKARELLESGRYLVSDAARLTGWSCPFYFCNSFKRRYGVPPLSVRK